MVEKSMTRKEKIAAGLPKPPKRKRVYAEKLKEARAEKVQVELRNFRSSPRKMRLVVDQIRGREVFHAINVLKMTSRRAAPAVEKLIRAAISSSEGKYDDEKVDVGTHYISEARVDGGKMLKRISPAPQGRAYIVRKRYCHVILTIDRIPAPADADILEEND
jgi:large subunit ribosomal protein L22